MSDGKRKRWPRVVLAVVIVGLVLLVGAEIGARVVMGLGNPPLFVHDPDIEYLYAPDGDYVRRGNIIHINAWGQRAEDFPQAKASPDELRVLAIGDSILFGGAQSDQSAIATEVLRGRLVEATGRAVVVGNASAGSWGPQNLLAYVRKFGTFDADVVLVGLNWADGGDVIDPTRPPTEDSHPTRGPMFGLQELLDRLLPSDAARPAPTADGPAPEALDATRELIAELRAAGHEPIVLLHPLRNPDAHLTTVQGLRGVLDGLGVEVVDLTYEAGDYRDNIHLNDAGNARLAAQMEAAVLGVLDEPQAAD